MEVNHENKSDSKTKGEKQSTSNVMNLLMVVKSTLWRFVFFFKSSLELCNGERIVAWKKMDFLLNQIIL